MKLFFNRLTEHLAKTLAPIYVVSGDEPLLTQEALDSIRIAAQAAGYSERVRVNTESNSEWGKLFQVNAQSLSLFASKRVLELDLTTVKLNAASSKILQEYAQHLPQDTVLVVRTAKLDSKSEQSSWYKALDKVGVMIPIWPIPVNELPMWLLQRAKKMQLVLTKGAADLIAFQVEGNLLAAAQELEKLRLLELSDTINEDTVRNTLTDNAHFDIFALVDSTLAGDRQRALRIMGTLAAEDSEPVLILWALARELRTLSELAKQVKLGVSLGALFPKFRIFEKRQASVRAFLQRHPHDSCWELLLQAATIDRIIKGAEKGNAWDALTQLTVRMAS